MSVKPQPTRGTASNPPNRFEALEIVPDPPEDGAEPAPVLTRFFRDPAKEILARNDSPDVGFDWGLNPYRGCEHGCVYCFARPTHEYLGLSAGLDFETQIFVKENAPTLLRRALGAKTWKGEVVAMSGVTDPYQPVERRLEITRRCLAVFLERRSPVAIITKSHLVARDADVLGALARLGLAEVNLSVTTLRLDLQRILEPRASIPARRLEAIRTLSAAGVPVNVLVAPVIPAINEEEIPAILAACAEAGARAASYVVLRLPHAVGPLFEEWLECHFPRRRDKVLNRLRSMHGGKLYDSSYHHRQRGQGVHADQIRDLFHLGCRRAGLTGQRPAAIIESSCAAGPAQLSLFGGAQSA